MSNNSNNFSRHILSNANKRYLLITLVISTLYFVILRYLYPIPSYYSDSFTWIGAAKSGQAISFRPIGYSKLLMFFRLFSKTDLPLIAAQYFTNVAANLFLFLTCTYFFPLRKAFKVILFLLLIVNPFYVFSSNYIYSDSFFNSLTVVWFTLTIWILYKPKWFYIILQIIILACLFELRYNAIIFPVFASLGILLSKSSVFKKTIAIAVNFTVIVVIVFITTYLNKKITGTKTFSAFSGWQMANNAVHVIRHAQIDTASLKDKEVKAVVSYVSHFFDTTKTFFPDTSASALYMWESVGPLKKYMYLYTKRKKTYFRTWFALGPVYSRFGQTVILQHPVTYFQHFVIPNAKAYFLPPLETYATYMEGRKVLPPVVTKFYQYKSNKTPAHYPAVYSVVFNPAKAMFTILNCLFILLALLYFFAKKYKWQSIQFNKVLLNFGLLFIGNFSFVVLLAPTVLRYHIFVLTLLFPIILYLLQSFLPKQGEIN